MFVIVAVVMTTQTFCYELTCKGFSTEKAQHLVPQQNDLCRFIWLTFAISLKLSVFTVIINMSSVFFCSVPFCELHRSLLSLCFWLNHCFKMKKAANLCACFETYS